MIISRSGCFLAVTESSIETLIKQTYTKGFEKFWLQPLYYNVCTNILDETSSSLPLFKSFCHILLMNIPDKLNSWQLGLICHYLLICRSKGWKSDKIIGMKKVQKLFTTKNTDKLQSILEWGLNKNQIKLPDYFGDIYRYLVRQVDGWIMMKQTYLPAIKNKAQLRPSFYFECLTIILQCVDKNCPWDGSDIEKTWNFQTTQIFNSIKSQKVFKESGLQNFTDSLTTCLLKCRDNFANNFIWVLLSTGFDKSIVQNTLKKVFEARKDDISFDKRIKDIKKNLKTNLDEV
eukprot:UN33118